MKIAFILTEFPSISQTFVLKQITGLIDLGHDIEIFALTSSCNQNYHSDVLKYKLLDKTTYFPLYHNRKSKRVLQLIINLKKYIFRYPKEILRTFNYFKYGKMSFNSSLLNKILPFLGTGPFDIVHCHFGPMGNIAMQCKNFGVLTGKIITTFHGYDLTSYMRSHGSHVYDMLFTIGDFFLPISYHWKEKLLEIGCVEEKIKVHRMGVDIEKFNFKKYAQPNKNNIRLLSIARLVEKKGIGYSIQAVYNALKRYPDIEYHIIGDGPLKHKLIELVSHLGINKQVRFWGWMNQNEIIDIMYQSDIVIAPSITSPNGDQEGIPVVLMEALSMGLPVISTSHSGIPELVKDGKSGFIVPEKDIDGLTDRLLYLIEHQELWPIMGREGRNYVKNNFNNNILNVNLENIFYSLVK